MFNGDVPWPQPDGSRQMGPNKVWDDKLVLTNYYKGRSAVNFIFTSELSGYNYEMGMGGFFDATRFMEKRKLEGKFTFYKQGTAYLIEKINDI